MSLGVNMSDRRGVSPIFQRHGHDRDDRSGVTLPDEVPADIAAPDLEFPSGESTAASDIESFAARIHQSLNPKEVMTVAVQELRPILRCERVCFLERRGKRFRLLAASGQPGLLPRSRQASLLEQIVSAVLPRGERFVYPEDHLTLPDDLARRLAHYWESANGQMILVEPVFSAVPDPEKVASQTGTRPVAGALVIEQFSRSSLNPGAIQRLDSALEHLTPALANARKYSRLLAVPGLYQLGLLFDLIRRTRTAALLMSLVIIAGLLACVCMVERPFEVECHGRLMPTVRREVFAGLEGEIVEVMVGESVRVEEGQIIARMQSRDLEKAILEQTGLLKGKLKARDAARAELHGRSTPQVRGQSSRDQAQLEVINAEIDTIHRQLELLEREQQQLVIRAPISGTVTTERPREKLLGRPVHRGESLLEIMDESGGWQIELAVAERKLGHLLSYRQHTSEAGVKFRLLSSAQQSINCTVNRVADRILPSPELGSCNLVFCDVSESNFPARQIGSETSARIQCGKKSLLFLWFHEFWELLQRSWWV